MKIGLLPSLAPARIVSMETPFIRLVGDLEENLYQLGVKDREPAKIIVDHISSIFALPSHRLNIPFKTILNLYLSKTFSRHSPYQKAMGAYIEGLGMSKDAYYGAIILPELMSCMSKWFPAIPTSWIGCSSFFTIDEDYDGPLHGRIMDGPIGGSYDAYERVVYYELKGLPKMIGINVPGMPTAGITGMNEYGVTLALHQKYTNIFNTLGTPIFELGFNLLASVKNKHEAIEFLKKSQSISSWCFYMSFADGDILRADLLGDRMYYHEDGLTKGKVLYFNNSLEDKSIDQRQFLPYGIDDFNEMRKKMAHKKILKLQHGKGINDVKLLKAMSLPLDQREGKASESKMDCITPFSLGAHCMNATQGRLHLIPGPAPKYYQGVHHSFVNLWTIPEIQYSNKSIVPHPQHKSMRHFMLAQTNADQRKIEHTYHHLQMCIDHAADYPESYWAQFYFHVYQFHNEPDRDLYPALLQSFRNLIPHLPTVLMEHALLYIIRLERLTDLPVSISADEIKNPVLRKILFAELNLPTFALKKMLDANVHPRMEFLDIMYGHLR